MTTISIAYLEHTQNIFSQHEDDTQMKKFKKGGWYNEGFFFSACNIWTLLIPTYWAKTRMMTYRLHINYLEILTSTSCMFMTSTSS